MTWFFLRRKKTLVIAHFKKHSAGFWGDVIRGYCFIPGFLVCVKMIYRLLELQEIFKFLLSNSFYRREKRVKRLLATATLTASTIPV